MGFVGVFLLAAPHGKAEDLGYILLGAAGASCAALAFQDIQKLARAGESELQMVFFSFFATVFSASSETRRLMMSPVPGGEMDPAPAHALPRTMSSRRPRMRSPSARKPLWAYSLVTRARIPRTRRAVSSANDRST